MAIIYFWSSLYNPNNSTKQLIDFLTLLQDSKQLTVTNVRTLKMTEDVLAVSISPEGKHIAVALLDCHVKVALSIISTHRTFPFIWGFINWKFGITLSFMCLEYYLYVFRL